MAAQNSDVNPISKLKLFKTAFSPLYEKFVTILHVHADDAGVPIITALVDGTKQHLFRPQELERYTF